MTATAQEAFDQASSENPFAGQGAVLLDIGGDIGALVVTMPAGMEGVEVEIRPLGAAPAPHHHHGHSHEHSHEHGHHPHVAVVNRPVGQGVVPSLVFPELTEGEYELYVKETDHVELLATVRGGEVSELSWPG